MSHIVEGISKSNRKLNEKINKLLEQEGIERDANLEYTCAILDEQNLPIATGSCFGNTLRCMAVDHEHQGEGLLNKIVLHLMEYLFERGKTHLFLYTKTKTAPFFEDLGFYEIARVCGKVSFLENRKNGFSRYLSSLKNDCGDIPLMDQKVAGAVVMNANPFTKGHQYLIEQAAKQCELLHVFVVNEERSLVPFSERWELVKKGTQHIKNVIYHQTGSYMISQETFPSYFLKEANAVCEAHARLDVAIFEKIAKELYISMRFVGEEPTSVVTGIYNQIMQEQLRTSGIATVVFPRKTAANEIISASTVRKYIHDGKIEEIRGLVPEVTWDYLHSQQALSVIERIQGEDKVIHY